jgi:Flp pilus assembly protein TadD
LRLLADVIKRAPQFSEAHYNYGLALKNREKVQDAVEELRAAVRLSPDNAKYLLALGVALADVDKRGAVKTLREALQHGANDAEAHYDLALALANDGDEAAAIEEFKRALELNPKHASALRGLGVALMHQSKFDESAAVLRSALDAAPSDAEAANNLGEVQLRLKDVSGAIQTLERAIQLNPSLIKAHANLAQAYQRAGRSTDAQHESRRVAALTAEQRNRGRAMVLVDSAKHQTGAEAISTLRQAIDASPNFADAHFQLGLLIRDPGEAIAEFRRVLSLDPERAEAHYEIGRVLERAEQKTEALREYRIAIEMAPCNEDAKRAAERVQNARRSPN